MTVLDWTYSKIINWRDLRSYFAKCSHERFRAMGLFEYLSALRLNFNANLTPYNQFLVEAYATQIVNRAADGDFAERACLGAVQEILYFADYIIRTRCLKINGYFLSPAFEVELVFNFICDMDINGFSDIPQFISFYPERLDLFNDLLGMIVDRKVVLRLVWLPYSVLLYDAIENTADESMFGVEERPPFYTPAQNAGLGVRNVNYTPNINERCPDIERTAKRARF